MTYRAQKIGKGYAHAGWYGIRDTERGCYVDKYGTPSTEYYAENAAVAKMRARDLRQYARDRAERLNVAGAITADGPQPAEGTPEGWGVTWV